MLQVTTFAGLGTLQTLQSTVSAGLGKFAWCKLQHILAEQRSTTSTSSLEKKWAFEIGGTNKA